MPANVKVNGESGYNIKIRRGLAERLGLEILKLNNDSDTEILLITDEKVSSLYLQKVVLNFHEYPKPEGIKMRFCELIIDSHEASKNLNTVSKLLEDMAGYLLSKNCCVVALGGSVVCDAAGFAAGCYMGGVRLVLVPTTLAAMVKASAGGHARLNLNAGENLAGMPYNPSLVLCDPDCLKTLSPDEYRSGLAEALKTAVVCGEDMFRIFERGEVTGYIERIIEGCIKYRAEISGNAEKLKALKLGCVFGTAIGALSGYKIQHGLATSMGIGIITNAGKKLGWCSEDTAERIINAMQKNDLPVSCHDFNASEIAKAIKNVSGKNIDIVVPAKIGQCEIKTVNTEELNNIISLGMIA